MKIKHLAAPILAAGLMFGVGTVAHAEYTVKSGDTFFKIAKAQNMSLADLISLNKHIADPNKIKVGDYIVIRSKSRAKDLVDYAKSLQAVTAYSYGGNNFPYQTDCSGWVKGIYGKFNIDLPRVSRDQAKTGTPVKFNNLQIGDLMFFSTAADKHITHVGIYMGDHYWISNLNSKKDVQVLSDWGSWSRQYFMWGTRYKL
jgi:cell wall-associated NlpC family hydrolase